MPVTGHGDESVDEGSIFGRIALRCLPFLRGMQLPAADAATARALTRAHPRWERESQFARAARVAGAVQGRRHGPGSP